MAPKRPNSVIITSSDTFSIHHQCIDPIAQIPLIRSPVPIINTFNSVQCIQSSMDEMALVNSNVGSLEAEGFHIPEETKLLALKGEMSFDDAIDQIISQFTS